LNICASDLPIIPNDPQSIITRLDEELIRRVQEIKKLRDDIDHMTRVHCRLRDTINVLERDNMMLRSQINK
jgi:hypothetical protein